MPDETKSLPHEPDATATRPPTDPDATTPASDEDARRSRERSSALPIVPGYSILEHIQSGGMGSVYKALHLRLNRVVALKLIHGGKTANPRDLIRFLGEAEAVAAIDHPHVVKVFDTGDAGGHPFLAMEYLPGGTLAQKLASPACQRRGEGQREGESHAELTPAVTGGARLSPRDAAELIRKLALAVQAAHDRQIVHRDLKPSNVMFDALGEPRITDFGLAKRAGGGLTNTNAIMGTAAYMAPEQAKGDSKFVGPAADVWALGVILYECLSGAKPFAGSHDLEIIQKVVDDEPSSLRSHVGDVPKDLELIVQKCLAKEPAARYESAQDLADDFANWLIGKSISVKAAGSVERAMKWTKRNKIAAGIMATSLAGLLAMTALAVWALGEERRADANAAQSMRIGVVAYDSLLLLKAKSGELHDMETRLAAIREQERQATQRIADAEIATRRIQDCNRIYQAGVYIERNALVLARAELSAVETPDLRASLAWALTQRHGEGSDWTLRGHTDAVYCVAWSPDGRTLATGSFDKTVRLWDAASGQAVKELKGHTRFVLSVAWSPDGRTLATGSADNTVRLWDAASGQTVKELKGHTSSVYCVAWSPVGRTLATGGEDKAVWLWDAASGQTVKELKGHTRSVSSVAWSPDGRTLVTGSYDDTVRLWDAASGQTVKELKGHTRSVSSVAWSPDGRTLATGSQDNTVRLWDAASGQTVKELKGHTNIVWSVAWSPDGRSLATGSLDETVRLWDAASGQTVKEWKVHTSSVYCVAWSPVGRTLATGGDDKTVRLWDAASGQTVKELKGHTRSVSSVAWSPDGRTLVTGSVEKTVRLWDTASGQAVKELKGHTRSVSSVAWSPDGRTLATGSADNTVRLWDAASGQAVKELKGHTSFVRSVAWSPDGRTLATGSADNTVRLWDAASGQAVKELKGHTSFVRSVAWSPDGRTLATGCVDNTVRLWDAASGQAVKELKGHTSSVRSVAWSPDGRTLAGCVDNTVRLWDAASGQAVKELKGHTDLVQSVAWSPDGRILASGSWDKTVRFWDVASGQVLKELKGHSEFVLSVAWSPDGRTLATGSVDKTVRLWDAAAGQTITELKGHSNAVISVSRNDDGTRIVSTANISDPNDPKRIKTIEEKIVWDANSGERLHNVPIPPTQDHPPRDDGFYYIPSGNVILKVSKTVPAEEVERRKRILAPHPEHHREQARVCEEQQQWFAAAFHLKRLLLSEPENAEVKARLAAAEARLTPREKAPLPRTK